MFIRFFNYIDFFGYKPSLYANRRTNYSSLLGGIVSILTFVCLLLVFIFLCKDYSEYYKNFSLSTKAISVKDYLLDFEKFFRDIRMGFELGQGHYKNIYNSNPEKYLETDKYTVKAYLQFNDFSNSYQDYLYLDLDTVICNNTNQNTFSNSSVEMKNYSDYFSQNTRNFLCFNKNIFSGTEKDLFKNFSEYINVYNQSKSNDLNFMDLSIKIDFLPCASNSSLCYPPFKYKDTGNTSTTGISLDLLYYSSLVDLNSGSYQQPLSEIISSTRNSISKEEFPQLNLNYRKVEIYSDSSYVFSSRSFNEGFGIESVQKETFYSAKLNGLKDLHVPFFSIKINLSKIKDIYYRRGARSLKLISEIGGLINFFIFVGKMILCIYNKSLENIYLMNRMFFMKCEENDYSKKIMETENIKIFNLSQHVPQNNIAIINNKLDSLKIDKKKDLRFSCMSRFFFIETCLRLRRHKESILMRKAMNIFKDKLEIGNIFKMQFNLEKLKYLILSRDQSLVLEYLDKVEMSRIEASDNGKGDEYNLFYDLWLNPQLFKKDDLTRAIFQIKISESEIDKKISELIN
jgi:hypothetical protein